VVFVQCEAPPEVPRSAREHSERHGSGATIAVALREREHWEPLDEVPADAHLIIRSDRRVELIAADLMRMLDERLARSSNPLDR
jgi:hypothetical protein